MRAAAPLHLAARFVAALAVALGPGSAGAESMEEACARTGDPAACEAAIAQNGADLASRRRLARTHLGRAEYAPAMRLLREVAALAPDDPTAHFELAATAATFSRFADGVEAIRAALNLAPDRLDVLRLAVIIFQALERDEDALPALARAAALGDGLSMFDLSEAYASGRGTPEDGDAARTWLERAAGTGHVYAMTRLAEIYRLGQLGARGGPARAPTRAERASEAEPR